MHVHAPLMLYCLTLGVKGHPGTNCTKYDAQRRYRVDDHVTQQ